MTKTIQKVLGSGLYNAHWIDRSNLVRLIASGILPCSNYIAQFEKRPERVAPPMWDFVFFVEDSCEKGLKVFDEEVVMVTPIGTTSIVIHDAGGIHDVPILEQHSPQKTDAVNHVVFARFPRPKIGHTGCVIVSSETLMSAYFYRAFSPATLEECERFVHDHDTSEKPLFLAGGEVPWPLII